MLAQLVLDPMGVEHGADPREKLLRIEGLHHVVVCAGLQAAGSLGRSAAVGQEDDRMPREQGRRPDHAAQGVGAAVRQRDVQEGEVGVVHQRERLGLGRRQVDLVAVVFQKVARQIGDLGVTFGDQDSAGAAPGIGLHVTPLLIQLRR